MSIIASRRGFLIGAASLLVAPAVVRAESLMRIAPQQLILPDRLKWHNPGLFGFLPVAGNERLYASIHGEVALIRGGRKFFRKPRPGPQTEYVAMDNGTTPIIPVERPARYSGPDGKLLDYYPPAMRNL